MINASFVVSKENRFKEQKRAQGIIIMMMSTSVSMLRPHCLLLLIMQQVHLVSSAVSMHAHAAREDRVLRLL